MANDYAGCEARKALLREWARWGEVYTGALNLLAKTWTKMPPETESVVLKNAERALKRCQEFHAKFKKHIAEHDC